MTLLPYFIDEKNKEVVFHVNDGYSLMMEMSIWMKSFPDAFKGISCRCEETCDKLRQK